MRFDPADSQILTDPYPHYRWMRENDPVHWGVSGDPNHEGSWYVTRYDDVAAALKDTRLGHELQPISQTLCKDAGPHEAIRYATRNWMFMRDPPVHTRLRALVAQHFMALPIEAHAQTFENVVQHFIDDAARRRTIDFIADFARPLSVLTVAGLLGVPAEDQSQFIPWTKALSAVIEFDKSELVMREGLAASASLDSYLDDLIAARRASPRDDLISRLLSGSIDPPACDDELKGTCTQLLFGGNEPVTHFMGLGLNVLLSHPEQTRMWLENRKLDRSAVDELLRFDASVQMTFRTALEDLVIGSQSITRGESIALVFGSANRDQDAYPQADELKLDRFPNRQLTLGRGIHSCMGANIVRLLGRLAFPALLRQLPDIAIVDDARQYASSVAVRGFEALNVVTAEARADQYTGTARA